MARQSLFMAGNIIAILNAAADGGTVRDVLERSGTNVPFTTLISWVHQRAQRQEKWCSKCAYQICGSVGCSTRKRRCKWPVGARRYGRN